MLRLNLCLLAAVATASFLPRSDDDPNRYTICGADRGYTEKDSLEAATYLREKVITSDNFFMAKDDCVYASVNTTIISLCNGGARDRHVNRAEVGRGVDQLIKDCGLEGGFTGIHVVNNLTFAAYGSLAGLGRSPPKGSPPPDVPGGRTRSKRLGLVKRDCEIAYDSEWHTDCDRKHELADDGSCSDVNIDNGCETYCEVKRRQFLGIETKAPGKGGEAQPAGTQITLEDSVEYSVSTGFSIGVDGSFKDAVSAGVSFQYSVTKTTGKTVGKQNQEDPPEGVDNVYGRWVFFPKLIESCGTVSKRERSANTPPCGTSVCPPGEPSCTGDTETTENVCTISPKLNSDDQPEVYWAMRWENEAGDALDVDKQSNSYKNVCDEADPDNDGEDECYNVIESRRRAPINFKRMEAQMAAL